MKVIFVITGLGMGGAENQVVSLADKLIDYGHEIKIISLVNDSIVKPKNEVEIIEMFMTKSPISIIKTLFKLRAIFSENKPDVIHSHMVHANILCRLVRLSLKYRKLICTAHSTKEGGRLLNFLYRITNSLSDVFSNVSRVAVEEFEKNKIVNVNEMICVYNGIDTDKFQFNYDDRVKIRKELNLNYNNKVFISIGRFVPEKNYNLLLNAFSKVIGKYPQSRLIIVGDGPQKAEISDMILKLKLSEHVHLAGVRRDVSSILSSADYFVLSSSWEGFGLVVAEAMACRRPVLATDCGGVSEVLGRCGVLVPVNEINAFADGMMALINLTAEEYSLEGERSRNFIMDNYSLDSVVEQWLKIYNI